MDDDELDIVRIELRERVEAAQLVRLPPVLDDSARRCDNFLRCLRSHGRGVFMTATTRRDGKRDAQRGVSLYAYVSRVCASARWTPDEMLPRFDHGYHLA